jgi:small subunit ribosomal protein S21
VRSDPRLPLHVRAAPDAPCGRFSTEPCRQYVSEAGFGKAAPGDFTAAGGGARFCRRQHPDPPVRLVGISDWRKAPVQVLVRDNNVDQALRVLKKKMQREGVFREMKLRRNYEKPSERRAREQAETVRRHRKLLRKRMEREGY